MKPADERAMALGGGGRPLFTSSPRGRTDNNDLRAGANASLV